MKTKFTFNLLLISSILLLFSFNFASAGVLTPNHYVIDNVAIVDEPNYQIQISPSEKVGSGYVYMNLTAFVNTDDYNFGFGFNTSGTKPKSIEIYSENSILSYDIQTTTLYDVIGNEITSESCKIGSENNYSIKRKIYQDGNSTVVCFNSFEQLGNDYTINYNEEYQTNWNDISDKFHKENINFNDKDTWFFIDDINLIKDKNYILRLNLDVKDNGKYDFVFYPSTYSSPQEAYQNNKIYYIDPTYINSNELVSYYALEDLTDSKGSNDLTNVGSTSGATGINNDAYSFDGNDYMYSSTDITSYPFSINLWAKTTGSNQFFGGLVDYSDTDTYYNLYLDADGKVQLFARPNGGNIKLLGSEVINDGDWHMITGVWRSATDRELYIDGISDGTSSTSANFISNVDEFQLGALRRQPVGITTPIVGDIDEVSVWNYGLDDNRVTELWNSNVGEFFPFEPSFDCDVTTDTILDADQTCTDLTISNNAVLTIPNGFSLSYERLNFNYGSKIAIQDGGSFAKV